MDNPAYDLRRAMGGVRTVVSCLALILHQFGSALRTPVDKDKRTAVTTPCRQIHARYLRNNLTPLFNIHPIAYPDVEQSDLLGIVQRRPFHDRSGQLNRFEIRHRRNGSGPPHLKIHRHQPRTGLFGLKLIGNSPTRRLRRIAQPFLIGKTIHLDHHPIGRKRQIVPRLIPMTDIGVDLLHRTTKCNLIGDLEPPLPRSLQTFVVRFERKALADQRIERAVQLATGSLRRILLLERSGRSITWIGKWSLPDIFPLTVQPFERLIRHQHLTPYLEKGGVIRSVQLQRHTADRPYIGRDIVAPRSVTPRYPTKQPSVLVGQADSRSIELQLAHILRLADLLAYPIVKLANLLHRVGIR